MHVPALTGCLLVQKMRVVILARPRDVTRKSDLGRLLRSSLDDNNAGFLEPIVQADDPVVAHKKKRIEAPNTSHDWKLY